MATIGIGHGYDDARTDGGPIGLYANEPQSDPIISMSARISRDLCGVEMEFRAQTIVAPNVNIKTYEGLCVSDD